MTKGLRHRVCILRMHDTLDIRLCELLEEVPLPFFFSHNRNAAGLHLLYHVAFPSFCDYHTANSGNLSISILYNFACFFSPLLVHIPVIVHKNSYSELCTLCRSFSWILPHFWNCLPYLWYAFQFMTVVYKKYRIYAKGRCTTCTSAKIRFIF